MTKSIETFIRATDKVGFDTHFFRYMVLALFDNRAPSNIYANKAIWKDLTLIALGVFPMFLMGLRFWTAPAY